MRPPGALSSMKHTSPCEPKNVRSGKPAATPIFFNLAAVTTSRFTARDVRVDPARHEPAPDGIDHGTRAVFAMTDQKVFPSTISMTVNFLAAAKPAP